MSRGAAIVSIVPAAVVIGLAATQVVASPVTVDDCHSDFFRPECVPLGSPVEGAIAGRWLVFWDAGAADLLLSVIATVTAASMLVAVLRLRGRRAMSSRHSIGPTH